MKFKFLPYNPELDIFVKSIWCIEFEDDKDNHEHFGEYITFACAYPTLVFQYDGDGFLKTSLKNKSVFIPRNHFTGLITQPINIATFGSFGLFGISLYPYATSLLFNKNPKESINKILDINSILKIDRKDAVKINALSNAIEYQEVISNILIKLINSKNKVDPILDATLKYILTNKGQSPIHELAEYIGYSIRQIENF